MTQIQNSSRPAYFDQFKSLDMSRDEDGILIVTMNDGSGGPLTFGGQDHTDFTEAFYRIGRDYDNKVVILTGAVDFLVFLWILIHIISKRKLKQKSNLHQFLR